MNEIDDILARLEVVFTKSELKYVIVGGLAAILIGKPRTTLDIDLIIENDPEKIQIFFDELKENDFDVMDDQVQLALNENTNISVFDKRSILRLDIKTPRNKLDFGVLNESVQIEQNNIKIFVAPVEYILLGKVWYLGNINGIPDEELLEYNDVQDFLNVYAQNKDRIDLAWLKSQAKDLNLVGTLQTLIDFCERDLV